jgi:hypothetical protein
MASSTAADLDGSLSISGTCVGTAATISAGNARGEGQETYQAGDGDADEALRPTVFKPAVDPTVPRPGVERLLELLDSTLRVVIADGCATAVGLRERCHSHSARAQLHVLV